MTREVSPSRTILTDARGIPLLIAILAMLVIIFWFVRNPFGVGNAKFAPNSTAEDGKAAMFKMLEQFTDKRVLFDIVEPSDVPTTDTIVFMNPIYPPRDSMIDDLVAWIKEGGTLMLVLPGFYYSTSTFFVNLDDYKAVFKMYDRLMPLPYEAGVGSSWKDDWTSSSGFLVTVGPTVLPELNDEPPGELYFPDPIAGEFAIDEGKVIWFTGDQMLRNRYLADPDEDYENDYFILDLVSTSFGEGDVWVDTYHTYSVTTGGILRLIRNVNLHWFFLALLALYLLVLWQRTSPAFRPARVAEQADFDTLIDLESLSGLLRRLKAYGNTVPQMQRRLLQLGQRVALKPGLSHEELVEVLAEKLRVESERVDAVIRWPLPASVSRRNAFVLLCEWIYALENMGRRPK